MDAKSKKDKKKKKKGAGEWDGGIYRRLCFKLYGFATCWIGWGVRCECN